MHLKGHLVLFQEPKPLNPVLVSQEVIVHRFRILGVVGVKVQHVTNATETFIEGLSLQHFSHIGCGQVAVADYGCNGIVKSRRMIGFAQLPQRGAEPFNCNTLHLQGSLVPRRKEGLDEPIVHEYQE
jgi:hypothetical protein